MVRKISKVKTTCSDTMWKSLNWVVISSEKNWRLQLDLSFFLYFIYLLIFFNNLFLYNSYVEIGVQNVEGAYINNHTVSYQEFHVCIDRQRKWPM